MTFAPMPFPPLVLENGHFFLVKYEWGCLVAKWIKRWTTDLEVPGSGPTGNRDFSLFRVHSALTQKLRRRGNYPRVLWRGH